MNIIFYLFIFIIGTLFGSFLTLATYRIPLHKDITHEHSFCPKCNHKLSFFDLIPIFSYLFLKGKCRYCKKKISPRYFFFELLTGLSFVLIALSLEFNIYNITINKIIEFSIFAIYIVFLLLVAGIDLKNKKIEKSTLIFGTTILCINIMYQYISATMDGTIYNLNRIILYLVFTIILLIVNIESIRKTKKFDYCIDILILTIIISLFTYEITTVLSIAGCLLIIGIRSLINKIYNKGKNKKERNNNTMPIAFYLISSHFIILITSYLYSLNLL
ncbi:MAG: prepilin peptidase [Clostridia bacterium]|nr:prepilin peptidase [Clostridia bacterium]